MSKIHGEWRKPEGGFTNDRQEAIEAWETLAAPIQELTGWKLSAFDPTIKLYNPETNQVVNLPVDLVVSINKGLKQT